MDRVTFNKFREIVYRRSGIVLGLNKEAFVSARVAKRMGVLNIQEPKDYLKYILGDQTGKEMVHFLNALSTNVTSFFREPFHFDFLARAVNEWRDQGQRRFRFWSAACSTGEEPYSMAITLLDSGITHDSDVKILATDISTRRSKPARAASMNGESLKESLLFSETVISNASRNMMKSTTKSRMTFGRC